jgi:hypothetical protein
MHSGVGEVSSPVALATDPSPVPGMVDPMEQRLLYGGARCAQLVAGESMVEFGTFFGRSTLSIADGLRDNPRGDASNILHAYDSFECDLRGGLVPYVVQFAKEGKVEELLDVRNGKVGFRRVFEHYLADHIASGRVRVSASELMAAEPPPSQIAFMHIDCPKNYREFKSILYRFFPRLRVGSVVIFQDYFYQWSAGLIAAVQLLVEFGIIRMSGSVASSLAVEIIELPTAERILALDLAMQESDLAAIIDRAIAGSAGIEISQKQRFLPRLTLAKVQYLWEQRQFKRATLELKLYLDAGGQVNHTLLVDFFDLMEHGFSFRALYDLDHSSRPPSSLIE